MKCHGVFVSSSHNAEERRRGEEEGRYILVAFTGSNLAYQMALLVIQILQLEVKSVNLRLCFGSVLLGCTRVEDCFAIQPTQPGKTCAEELLLLGQLQLELFTGSIRAVVLQPVEHVHAMRASFLGSAEHRLQRLIRKELISFHDPQQRVNDGRRWDNSTCAPQRLSIINCEWRRAASSAEASQKPKEEGATGTAVGSRQSAACPILTCRKAGRTIDRSINQSINECNAVLARSTRRPDNNNNNDNNNNEKEQD